MINLDGEEVSIYQLCKRHNLPWSTINNRLLAGKSGRDLVRPARVPITVNYNGKNVTLNKLAELTGISASTIKRRYSFGLTGCKLNGKKSGLSGNKNAAIKLTEADVVEIKKLLLLSTLNQREIGLVYNIDQSHVSDIKRGKRWASVNIDIESAIGE